MSERVALVRCPEAAIYDHGPEHPLRPDRVLLTWDLIDAYGLSSLESVESVPCRQASDEELQLVHSAAFIDATRRAGHGEKGNWSRFGYGPGDNPIFPKMHEAGALVAGASIVAAEKVRSGEAEHSFNAAGGLHHSMPSRASGFCVYDDPAIAIARLLADGVKRVAYVDVDVHHGDGPQAIFYDDPRVLTISIHQYGMLFPGTGWIDETGTGEARGTKVNVPLPAGVTDAGWLRAFRAVVPPLIRQFEPEVLVTQLGCDTHGTDPLAMLALSTGAYRKAAVELHSLAHEVVGGRWVATGGGGYQWARVVPRAWTIYFAEMCGVAIPEAIPLEWLEEAERRWGGPVPRTLSDGEIPESPADAKVPEILGRVAEAVSSRFELTHEG